jgi:hypothetical protein
MRRHLVYDLATRLFYRMVAGPFAAACIIASTAGDCANWRIDHECLVKDSVPKAGGENRD